MTMEASWHIGVVVPARNEALHIQKVLETMHPSVDLVVVVDDGSTDETRIMAETAKAPCEVHVLTGGGNGVGASIDLGHLHLLKTLPKPFVSVVMAGDGQMNPDDLSLVIQPVLEGKADHVKGNRRRHSEGYNRMPKVRQWASTWLSLFTTLASGVPVTDPQCGYTATSSELLEAWDWSTSWKGYGYPNYWWIRLSRGGWRTAEVPVESIYRNERSGIKKGRFFASVGWMMALEHHRRNIAWVKPPNLLPHSLFALMAYMLGWSAVLPMISNDLERVLFERGVPPLVLLLFYWGLAHLFDRMAARAHRELRHHAKT